MAQIYLLSKCMEREEIHKWKLQKRLKYTEDSVSTEDRSQMLVSVKKFFAGWERDFISPDSLIFYSRLAHRFYIETSH